MAYGLNFICCFLLASIISSCNSSTKNQEDRNLSTDTPNTGFIKIFNGENLEGWEGDTAYWRVENGNLVGEITPETSLKQNSFIIWRGGSTADFELKVENRITANGNSGINYRSEELQDIPYALKGYQADIDGANNYTGQNYEERGRTTLAYRGQQVVIPTISGSLRSNIENNAWAGASISGSLGETDSLKNLIKKNNWNEIHIIAKGNHLQHYVNGILMSEVIDKDTLNRRLNGWLGMQVHVGPPMKVEYRNVLYKSLNGE